MSCVWRASASDSPQSERLGQRNHSSTNCRFWHGADDSLRCRISGVFSVLADASGIRDFGTSLQPRFLRLLLARIEGMNKPPQKIVLQTEVAHQELRPPVANLRV